MKKALKIVYRFFLTLGLNPVQFLNLLKGLPEYINDYKKIKIQKKGNKDFYFGTIYPIVASKHSNSGIMSGHYFHQDLLVAKKIYQNKPLKHIDIGSRIDGFIAHIAVFREIEIFDIRPQKTTINNIVFRQADLMKLPDNMLNYCDSISSLHAVEHFGLGRYGDPVDYYGHLKVLENIYRILQNRGKFYFSVPIGNQRIEFNAHRVFDLSYLLKLFENKYQIDSFSYVNDVGDIFENAVLDEKSIKNNFNCYYGCGIFEMTKNL
jgi:SAM-dependent methyltransferase